MARSAIDSIGFSPGTDIVKELIGLKRAFDRQINSVFTDIADPVQEVTDLAFFPAGRSNA